MNLNKFLILAAFVFVVSGSASAAPEPNARIWRIQLSVATANKDDAGTNNDVRVQLNDQNSTWIDYAGDDFERGSKAIYDLNVEPNMTLNDITQLKVSKGGDDGWAIEALSLRVNGRIVFSKTFSPASLWLDNCCGHTRSFTIPSGVLRSHVYWQTFIQQAPPTIIPRGEIESRVESLMGQAIRENKLYWGALHGRGVEVTRASQTKTHVDLDLAADVPVVWDPEVDVDFDLIWSCNGNMLSVISTKPTINVDSKWYSEILSLGIVEVVDDKIENYLKSVWSSMSFNPAFPACKTINVQADGSVRLVP